MHITAEYDGYDMVNSGFAVCGVTMGMITWPKGGIAFIPTEINVSDDNPWVLFVPTSTTGYTTSYLSDITTSIATASCHGIINETLVSTPALTLDGDSNITFPNGMNNIADTDVICPVIFGAPNTIENSAYKGISNYMQWNGVFRNALELLNSSTRISFGDVNFPWDGVSVPRI